jgi:hypothetical protein
MNRTVICCWPSPAQSRLSWDTVVARDHIFVLSKTFIVFLNGAFLTRGGVVLPVTTPSRTVICCWPSPVHHSVLSVTLTGDGLMVAYDQRRNKYLLLQILCCWTLSLVLSLSKNPVLFIFQNTTFRRLDSVSIFRQNLLSSTQSIELVHISGHLHQHQAGV